MAGAAAVVFNLRGVEAVPAGARLVDDSREVALERGQGLGAGTEALELRVVAVAARLPAEHGSSQEPLAPQGDEASGVKEAGVEGPEAHRFAR
jgi:hypothetical protein